MFFIYRILINLILVISPIIIFFRLIKKKEHPIRFKEKFGFYSKKKTSGKLIWIHGASVGEILSIVPLLEKLENNKKIKQILITSNTLSSSKILSNLKLKKTIHQFFPIDTNYHTQKFLDYWKPSLAIFVDSEIWPNMIENIKKRRISLMLMNARITKKSFKKWKRISLTAKSLFNKFDLCLPSSAESKKHLELLNAKNIKYIGNLKFTESEIKKDNSNKNLKKFFSTKKVWCASSTHNNEEEVAARVHLKLKKKNKNILTVIIPRHISRTAEIADKLKRLNLKVHIHSTSGKIAKNTDIYLVDIYGKTKMFFSICKIVFLGGSLIKHGGQNPLEAARFGCQILHGPNIWNFNEIYNLLNEIKVSYKVGNTKQIVREISMIFIKKNNTKNIKYKLNSLSNRILKLTLKEIDYFIIKK